jgi:triosephosphate isomerase
MPARRPLVAANWKLNGSREANARLLGGLLPRISDLGPVDVVICPPFVYLAELAAQLAASGVQLGAQDVAVEESGAYTGEVSAAMLRDVGCRYVIVGHSERRSLYDEDDQQVAAKFAAALRHGLVPILCVGETLDERERGATLAVIERQLRAVLDQAGPAAVGAGLVAYEPVWAIGTGRTATPEQAQEVHAAIRGIIAAGDARMAGLLRILYGGSVKGSNAASLFAMEDIDGGLIGGASLEAGEFLGICRAATGN